jgi:hypothetical protein
MAPVLLGVLILIPGLASRATAATGPTIELAGSADTGFIVEVSGLGADQLADFDKLSAEERTQLLQLFVVSESNDLPPLDGTLSVVENRLRFAPRYPLEPGLKYRAVFEPGRLSGSDETSAPVTQELALEAKRLDPTTVVEQIYPSGDVLPENQLKFYVHFSAPMSRGEAYRHVHLLDADGREVEGAFLELGEELWDSDQQRFTLLFDPGRVKRGLKPREELGPVLVERGHYTLVVDNAWRDATRTPLNAGARKSFIVGPPDETAIDPQSWEIASPVPGSFDPLLVRFGESLDHSLLERIVWVTAPGGERVEGTIHTGDGEACWQFTPRRAWTAGAYSIVAETTLEDLAGNAIGRPFEVDEFKPVEKRIETKTISLPFEVK